jgi:hypothetical protein
MEMSEQVNHLAKALCKAQGEMGGAVKDSSNPFFKSSYADLSSVIKAIKDSFAANGLSYTQFPVREENSAGVETILMHESGQWIKSSYTLPLSKFDAQSAGSCLTYARRYALQAIAGIPAVDDDGNDATAAAPPAYTPASKPAQPKKVAPAQQAKPANLTQQADSKSVTINGKKYHPMDTCNEINACATDMELEGWIANNRDALNQVADKNPELNGIIKSAVQQRKQQLADDIPF